MKSLTFSSEKKSDIEAEPTEDYDEKLRVSCGSSGRESDVMCISVVFLLKSDCELKWKIWAAMRMSMSAIKTLTKRSDQWKSFWIVVRYPMHRWYTNWKKNVNRPVMVIIYRLKIQVGLKIQNQEWYGLILTLSQPMMFSCLTVYFNYIKRGRQWIKRHWRSSQL